MSECMHPSHSDDVSAALRGNLGRVAPGELSTVFEVWHGRSTPAVGCGFHAFNFGPELAAAHNAMLAGE